MNVNYCVSECNAVRYDDIYERGCVGAGEATAVVDSILFVAALYLHQLVVSCKHVCSTSIERVESTTRTDRQAEKQLKNVRFLTP